MAKNDFGRFRNRGANNGRFTIGNTQPEDPVINDIWVNPDIVTQYIQKTTSQGFVTTTIANVVGLGAVLGAGGTYKVDVCLFVQGPTATDIKVDWDYVCDATSSYRGVQGPAVGVTDVTDTNVTISGHNLGTDKSYGIEASANGVIRETFIVTTAAATGSVQCRAAQVNTTATRVTISSNSYIIVAPLVSNIKYYNGIAWTALL